MWSLKLRSVLYDAVTICAVVCQVREIKMAGSILRSILLRFQIWTALPWLLWHYGDFKLFRSKFCAVCQKLLFLELKGLSVSIFEMYCLRWGRGGVFTAGQKWNHNIILFCFGNRRVHEWVFIFFRTSEWNRNPEPPRYPIRADRFTYLPSSPLLLINPAGNNRAFILCVFSYSGKWQNPGQKIRIREARPPGF